MMKQISTLFFVFLFPLCVFAQDVFVWKNPSFEAEPNKTVLPESWNNLYFDSGNSPVDVQPGFFNCTHDPFHGSTYIGMVSRDDGSFEGVYQTLDKPLKKDSVYTFSIWVCHSDRYFSSTWYTDNGPIDLNAPIKLGLMGLDDNISAVEKLAESKYIKNKVWEQIKFVFQPKKSGYRNIALVAIDGNAYSAHKNGNVLIDLISPIEQISATNFKRDSIALEGNDKIDHFKKSGEILLNNPTLLGNYTHSFYEAWDIFVADSKNVMPYGGMNRISDSIPEDSRFDLKFEPHFGSDGLYLVGNKNGKWSGAGQKIPIELLKNNQYNFSLTLWSKDPGELYKNGEPLRFKLWGGSKSNPRQELLAKTYGVDSKRRKEYSFVLEPKDGNWDYLYMEAYSITDGITYYNGNLAVSNCSAIKLVKNK